MMNKSPIYIIGSERSGTNLLQTLISNHKNIDGPLSPHLINTLVDSIRYYGNLNVFENGRRLFSDLLLVANHPFRNWNIKVSYDEFLEQYEPGFFEMVSFLYDFKLKESKKARYISKELNSHKQIEQILKIYPEAKFIHLIRDPREQVASWMRTPLPFLNPFDAIKHWVQIQDYILNKQAIFPNDIMVIRYEDVVQKTVPTIKKVLTFIGEDLDENCYTTSSKKNTGSDKLKLWENLNKPVSNDISKHSDILSKRDVQMIETISKSIMLEIGYQTTTKVEWENSTIEILKRFFKNRQNSRKRTYKGYELIRERISFAKTLKESVKNNYLTKKIK